MFAHVCVLGSGSPCRMYFLWLCQQLGKPLVGSSWSSLVLPTPPHAPPLAVVVSWKRFQLLAKDIGLSPGMLFLSSHLDNSFHSLHLNSSTASSGSAPRLSAHMTPRTSFSSTYHCCQLTWVHVLIRSTSVSPSHLYAPWGEGVTQGRTACRKCPMRA